MEHKQIEEGFIKDGNKSIEESDWEKAIENYSAAYKMNPNNKEAKDSLLNACLNAGKHYDSSKKWELALLRYNKAYSIDSTYDDLDTLINKIRKSDSMDFYLKCGEYALEKGAIDLADTIFSRLYRIDPEYPPIKSNMQKTKNAIKERNEILNKEKRRELIVGVILFVFITLVVLLGLLFKIKRT